MMIQNASGRRNGLRSHSGRRLAPAIEAFERRQLLTGGIGYIAGTVYLDSNGSGAFNDTNAYLPGARIDLSIAGQQGILASTTTDANGGYTFRGLDPGNYILTETLSGLEAFLEFDSRYGCRPDFGVRDQQWHQ